MRESGFCCCGCSYVFRLVHEHGLAGYYRIKDAVTTAADAAVFQPRDYGWLAQAQQEAEQACRAAGGSIPELTLDIQGISCAGCVWLIERLVRKEKGARDIIINAQLGSLRLRWFEGAFSAVAFARTLQSFGYLLGPDDPDRTDPESGDLLRRVGLCAAFALNVMLFTLPTYFGMERNFTYAPLFALLSLAFGTLSFLVGGSYFIGRAWRALNAGAMHIDLPIALGILGAYTCSVFGWMTGDGRLVYFDFLGVFVLLMLVGRWAQVAAIERNRRRLLGRQPNPRRVRLIAGPAAGEAREADVAPAQLRKGDRFLIAGGETVPVDARLLGAESSFSLASIHGEADPRAFRLGQRIPSGAVSIGRGEIALEALQAWNKSLLYQLMRPGERRDWRHSFMERVVRGYLVGILLAAVGAGIGWWMATHDFGRTGAVVTAVLVVSCPCAIGFAFPLANEIATTALRRHGVYVREDEAWARLSAVRKLVFDKTGTLTLETPVLQNPATLAALGGMERNALFSLVHDSQHPVSQSLLEALLASGPAEPMEGEVTESVGFGVELGPWSLGRAGWRTGANGTFDGADPAGAATELAHDGRIVARFEFADSARPDAGPELKALESAGFEVHILSGDRPEKVLKLARELGLPPGRVHGGLSPSEKAAWFDAEGAGDALMLGDGANDSLAFDRALCRGTPVIHRGVLGAKADFYYLGRGIGGIRALFAVNHLRRRAQASVLIFSIAYNLAAVGMAVAGRMNPLVAAVLMPASSLITLALVSAGMRRSSRPGFPQAPEFGHTRNI